MWMRCVAAVFGFGLGVSAASQAPIKQKNITTDEIGNSYFTVSKKNPVKKPINKPIKRQSTSSSDDEIGNSYFAPQGGNYKKSIRQLGLASEEHQALIAGYLYWNQYLANHIFYELRGYLIHHYLTQTPAVFGLSDHGYNVNESAPLGYGGMGILGYNFDVTSNFSIMPFARAQVLTNDVAAYKDTMGNEITSTNSIVFLGLKLSMKVTDNFAVYSQYFAGYGYDVLYGRGVFAKTKTTAFNSLISVLEWGAPYRVKSWNITPYFQFITAAVNPNRDAKIKPYFTSSLTTVNPCYGIKIGYEF